MKGFDEFRSYGTRLHFDAESGSFIAATVVHPFVAQAETQTAQREDSRPVTIKDVPNSGERQ